MDADLFLAAETFRLSPDVTTGQRWHGTYAIKSASARGYLTIDDRLVQVLNQFAEPRTVPEALENCIRSGTCIPLREFYDLVLKAYSAGVLQIDGAQPTAAKPAVRWPVKVKPSIALVMMLIAAVAGLVLFVAFPVRMPATILELVYGWVGACLALSVGHVIGACVLRGAECEVYQPRIRVHLGVFPHFGVDLRDSCMAHVRTRAAINGAPLFPVCVLAAVGQALHAAWTIVPAVVLLLEGLPVARTTVNNLLFLLRKRPLLATDRPALFDVQLRVGEQLRLAWTRFDGRVALAQAGTAIGWTGVVAFGGCRMLHYDPRPFLRHLETWRTPAVVTGVALTFITCVWLIGLMPEPLAATVVAAWRRLKRLRARWTAKRQWREDEIEALVRRNPLLRRLEPEAQAEFVKHLSPVSWQAWKTIVGFEEQPKQVAIIACGAADVYRRVATGRPTRFLRLEEGDIFGAHQLVDPEHTSLEVRARTPMQAFVIPVEDFRRLVVQPLSAEGVKQYMHKHLFLQRVSRFCRDWRPAAVGRFAELARTTKHSAGAKLIHRGDEVHSLFVLYKGKAYATRNSRRIGTLKPGDAIGEISLLQSGTAVADIEATEDAQFLQINRLEFIRFLARNHHVALSVERTCKERLGMEVFVSGQKVFDGR